MGRPIFVALALALAVGVAGCGATADKQWYKPGGSYTVAEFQKDYADCTKKGKLDEACLKARGWISLSGDIPPKPKTLEEQERERHGATGPITPTRY